MIHAQDRIIILEWFKVEVIKINAQPYFSILHHWDKIRHPLWVCNRFDNSHLLNFHIILLHFKSQGVVGWHFLLLEWFNIELEWNTMLKQIHLVQAWRYSFDHVKNLFIFLNNEIKIYFSFFLSLLSIYTILGFSFILNFILSVSSSWVDLHFFL